MKERIAQILKHYQITSSKLAELLGVQRSGISHILSGRNNPSYDFIVKLMEKFPQINANWLLLGTGDMHEYTSENIESESIDEYSTSVDNTNTLGLYDSNNNANIAAKSDNKSSTVYKSNIDNSAKKTTEKVIILYSNGVFKEYQSDDLEYEEDGQ